MIISRLVRLVTKALRDVRTWAGAGLILSAGLVALVIAVQQHRRSLDGALIGARLAELRGVSLDGDSFRAAPSDRCVLIRYGSRACPFSQSDIERFNAVRSTLANTCTVVVLAPLSDVFGGEGDRSDLRIGFVTPELSNSQLFIATPVTAVLDANRQVVWYRVGALRPEDPPQAVLAAHRQIRGDS